MRRRRSNLLQGTVEILILQMLDGEPIHGYAVSQAIRERTDGELELEDAALYQALHRLEGRELVTSRWGITEKRRRAKYYELTDAGRERLRTEVVSWRRYVDAVSKVLEPV